MQCGGNFVWNNMGWADYCKVEEWADLIGPKEMGWWLGCHLDSGTGGSQQYGQ